MRFIQHPFFERDIIGIANHIVEVTQGDTGAAYRRLDEIDALLEAIANNPASGLRLSGNLEGWLVRHGGTGNRLTIVFKGVVAWSMKRSERALPETDFRRYVRTWGGQVRSSG